MPQRLAITRASKPDASARPRQNPTRQRGDLKTPRVSEARRLATLAHVGLPANTPYRAARCTFVWSLGKKCVKIKRSLAVRLRWSGQPRWLPSADPGARTPEG